jgi:long-chain acyl-CoA synthetase
MTFNLAVILRESAAAAPERTVVFYPGGQLTYGELDELSGTCAAALTGTGLRPGDKVALQLPNIPQFLIATSAS